MAIVSKFDMRNPEELLLFRPEPSVTACFSDPSQDMVRDYMREHPNSPSGKPLQQSSTHVAYAWY